MKNGELRFIYPLKSIYIPNIQSNNNNKIKNGTVSSSVVHIALHTHTFFEVVFFGR